MAKRTFLGFTIGKDDEEIPKENLQAFSLPENEDAALDVLEPASAGVYGTYLDLEGTVKDEVELITRYREMSLNPEVELAVDDIINESVITEHGKSPVAISLSNLAVPKSIKNKITDEFEEVLRLLSFYDHSYDIFRRWYVDGRLFYHIMIDKENPSDGIQELRALDPRQIKKVREKQGKRTEVPQKESGLATVPATNDFYIYFPGALATRGAGFGSPKSDSGIKIASDAIAHIHSGLLDPSKKMILGYLHKAIKPMNQLKMLEDATVIYRISRAPERRVFYVDVGNLPKVKAEQYLAGIMSKFKNKTVYDTETGEVRDDRRHMSMLEDFWLPRREGGRGTEITTLPGGTNLGEIEDIIYFKKKLYKALGVPVSRLEPEGSFSLGRATEISRDEVKFGKFVNRLRSRFTTLFDDILGKQLQLKGILSKSDWEQMLPYIEYSFQQDSHFAELKNIEIMRERMEIAQTMEEYVGKYYSSEWVRKNILSQTEAEIRMIDKQIKAEENDGEYDDLPDSDEDNEVEPKPPSPPEPDDDDEEEEEESYSVAKKVRLLRNRTNAALAAAVNDEDFE